MAMNITYGRTTIKAAFQANTFEVGNQGSVDILGLTNGGFVAAYANPDNVVRLNFYGTNLSPIGGADVPSVAPTSAFTSALTRLANGNVLAVWADFAASDNGLKGRLFTAGGNPLGTELDLTPPGTTFLEPSVTALSGGRFVVAYRNGGGTGGDIFARLYDASGEFLNGSQVDGVANPALTPAVAVLKDGGYVVTYTENLPDQRLRGAIYNANGTERKDDFLIDSIGDNNDSAVAGLANGNWAVVYQDTGWGGGEGSTAGITLQIFSATGVNVTPGTFIHVNTPSNTGQEDDPDITVLENGFFVVTWHVAKGGTLDVRARVFSQDGKAVTINGSSAEFSLASSAMLDERGAAVSAIKSGRFVTAWADEATDGSGERISSRVDEITRTAVGDVTKDVFSGDALRDFALGGGGDDSLAGNGGNDRLAGDAGNDFLNGGAGADLMRGGGGNDICIVDSAGDIVDESVAGSTGFDEVRSSVSFSLSDAAHARGTLEKLTLLGGGNVNGTGNAIANDLIGNAGNNGLNGLGGADLLVGNAGNDVLDGGAGGDLMIGGAGNDTYAIDETADEVDEAFAGSGGIDTVRSSIGFNLSDVAQVEGIVENLTLVGAAPVKGVGSDLANVMAGNSGANVLAGRLGNDMMTGGGGPDGFLFDTKPDKTANVDHITDLLHKVDKVRLDDDVFKALDPGKLPKKAFVKGSKVKKAKDDEDLIAYNTTSGAIYYDKDGKGGAKAKLFAVLDGSPDDISARDFLVVA